MFVGDLYIFFGEMSVQVFCTFLDCVVCFYNIELHEQFIYLEIKPLSVDLFANIFSHSQGCLFILFVVSFALQKLLSFIRSHFIIFVFISFTLGGGSKKILL